MSPLYAFAYDTPAIDAAAVAPLSAAAVISACLSISSCYARRDISLILLAEDFTLPHWPVSMPRFCLLPRFCRRAPRHCFLRRAAADAAAARRRHCRFTPPPRRPPRRRRRHSSIDFRFRRLRHFRRLIALRHAISFMAAADELCFACRELFAQISSRCLCQR
jgi:hypothetical protein